MNNKFKLIGKILPSFVVIFFLIQITTVNADDGQDIIKLPPHPDLGIVDINTGLETAHDLAPPGLGYKFFDANYQQASNLGVSWNRWKVDWSAVETEHRVSSLAIAGNGCKSNPCRHCRRPDLFSWQRATGYAADCR